MCCPLRNCVLSAKEQRWRKKGDVFQACFPDKESGRSREASLLTRLDVAAPVRGHFSREWTMARGHSPNRIAFADALFRQRR
ncbi:hypothetical protein HMPREF0262_03138 [Clostridium sp. ATCC 29733]|nr:hypothetical protein HMPREF0262_03138 [Clostridium sp. ATCC 29733]